MRNRAFLLLFFVFLFLSCPKDKDSGKETYDNSNVVVMFTNDMRCSLLYKSRSEDSSLEIGYPRIKAYKSYVESATKSKVVLVDIGSYAHSSAESTGSTYAQYTQGAGIIDVMNDAGYSYAVLGTEEFAYGIKPMIKWMQNAKFTFLCSNLYKTNSSANELNKVNTSYAIEDFNGTKVAFIGVVSPEAKSMKPLENWDIYDKSTEIVREVNYAIEEIKRADNVDFIILLSCLGAIDNKHQDRYTSSDLLREISDVDFVLDGKKKLSI